MGRGHRRAGDHPARRQIERDRLRKRAADIDADPDLG
jgi:hypothetical protein